MIKKIENLKRRFVILIKLNYYKIKYGKQLIIGKNNKFRKRFNINIAKNAKLIIGDNNFWNDDCSINVREEIRIGNQNLFGKNVNIYDHNHIFNNNMLPRGQHFKTNKIIIGNNNWFGTNVTILSNSKIGNNNVFGAGITINEEVSSNKLIKEKQTLIYEDIKYKN